MALCQADSLLACQGVDTRDQADRYLRWLREGHRSATGVAAGVRPELRRLLALAAARHSALTGVHDPRVLDSEPLARCAPAALYYGDDLEAAAEAGADAVRITHQAPVLVDACRLFTAMIHVALAGADRPAVLAHARQWDGILKPEVLAVADGWSSPAGAGARRPRGAILAMLDAVVKAFAQAPDFRSGLLTLLAQPVGRGEPDVAAAAYGQLAGAWFGERGLPDSWRAGLVDAAGIASVAEALASARAPVVGTSSGAVPQGLQSR
jgi:ADP-ribosylglycohydrolase